MLYNFYFSDFVLVFNDILFFFLVLFSLSFYVLFETKFFKKLGFSFFYSVVLYALFLVFLYFYNEYIFSEVGFFYVIFNYTLSNSFLYSSYKLFLIFFSFMLLFSFVSQSNFSAFKIYKFEYVYIFLFIILSGNFLLLSCDFISMFLNLELQNFCFYILLGMQKNKKIVSEISVKYYIYGGISSIFILYGISLLYIFTGHINYFDIVLFLSFNSDINLVLWFDLCL